MSEVRAIECNEQPSGLLFSRLSRFLNRSEEEEDGNEEEKQKFADANVESWLATYGDDIEAIIDRYNLHNVEEDEFDSYGKDETDGREQEKDEEVDLYGEDEQVDKKERAKR